MLQILAQALLIATRQEGSYRSTARTSGKRS